MVDWERLEKALFLVDQSALVTRGNTLEACESEKLSRAFEDKKKQFFDSKHSTLSWIA